MKKLWFKLFGETKIIFWIWGISALLYLTVLGLIAWAAIHFIVKYW